MRVRMLHMGVGGVVATLVGGALFVAFVAHRIVAHTLTTSQYYEAPIHQIPRQCPAPEYLTLDQVQKATPSSSLTSAQASNASDPLHPKICVTTLTDQLQADWKQKLVKWRQFNDLLSMTWPNKQAWCDIHGYHLVDSSPYLDNSRPPSWSKIVAARRLLVEEHCDWVLWLDADTVIMNSTKRIESFLPAPNATHDFVVTRQKSDSFNAGAWAIRNTPWAIQFLDDWWNMESFVRPKGLSVSGDNDALYNFLKEKMPNETFQKHIRVPPRCQFNSNTKWITKKEAIELEQQPDLVKEQDYYMHLEYYHKGDLVAHIAGRNNKVDTTEIMLQHAT
eukprot:Nitzschia sp. Nitz4//scaffold7_size249615//246568//247569//NITZ4_001223-RA/size249615-processed-gene-0.218-mRNA-1//-1//CDS//3329558580//5150//frame0